MNENLINRNTNNDKQENYPKSADELLQMVGNKGLSTIYEGCTLFHIYERIEKK